MIPLIERAKDDIAALCRRYRVLRLDHFGSAATAAFREDGSDLDFVVTFAGTRAPDHADRYLDFAEALEALLGRHVGLVTERSIRNPYFRRAVEATRGPRYERRDQEAAA